MALSRPRNSRSVVLLVQQNRDDREMYAEFLRYRRWRPVIALTVAQALELAPASDVIVTDVALPNGADGLEFIAEIRRHPQMATMPIVVLTATLLTSEQQRVVESVCDGFLRKPCLPAMLVREIRRVLAATRLSATRPNPAAVEPRKLRAGARRSR